MFIVPVKKDNFYQVYLQILNGILKLTRTEIAVLAQFMEIRNDLSQVNLDKIYIDRLVFSSENRKIIKEKLNISEQNLNNYIKSLKDKKALLFFNNHYSINPKIFITKQQANVQFTIKIQGN